MTSPDSTAIIASAEDWRLVEALRHGDEAAFTSLVDRLGPAMLRLAMTFVADRALAEDVVQETWIGVLRGLDRFEGRASLKTWIFRILANVAKTRAQRERRSVPFSMLGDVGVEADESAVDPDRFHAAGDSKRFQHWISFPNSWAVLPEDRLLARETLSIAQAAIDALPPNQRQVILLRDVEGWPSEEACNVLGLSESNQRVLLHRARSKVRRALEQYFDRI